MEMVVVPPRSAGIFIPLFALRSDSDLGVGDTQSLREMVDWCRDAGFSVLQLLPINETSDDNSPYNAISSMALDITTLAISPELTPGLEPEDYKRLAPKFLREELREGPVSYKKVKLLKWGLCEVAFEGFRESGGSADFLSFCQKESHWLDDYALFRGLMERYGNTPTWEEWPEGVHTPAAARQWLKELPEGEAGILNLRVEFFKFVQWLLYRQWDNVTRYAESQGVKLMGDVPFGVSWHSADVWAEPQYFDSKWCGGAPPEPLFQHDAFTRNWGQNWGIPVYKWDELEKDEYAWWRRRVGGVSRFFKIFRIDHVLGFYRIYAFPWRPSENEEVAEMDAEAVEKLKGALPRYIPGDDNNPEEMPSNKAQGEKLLKVVLEAAGSATVIGEDLGMVPDYMRPSLMEMGISCFKIPLFERQEWDQEYKPLNEYPELTLATLSTHDHQPMSSVWDEWWRLVDGDAPAEIAGEHGPDVLASWELFRTLRMAGMDDRYLIREYEPSVRENIIRQLFRCPSWLVVLTLPDLLGMKTRFNVPGPVADSNWSERLPFTVKEFSTNENWKNFALFAQNVIQETGRCLE